MRVDLAPLSNYDLGALAALVVAFVAFRVRALSASGAIFAVLVGTATIGGLGAGGAAILLAFFVSSVGLSRLGKTRKRELVDIAKTGARDGAQVFANGGVAAVCAIVATHEPRYAVAFAGAFAAATADTWGTEIGTLVRQAPRSIFTLRPIATGLSGGVTAVGTLAEAAGAAWIGAVAYLAGIHAFVAIAAAGIAGALIDSLLGGSLQSLRFCPQCRRFCETEPHVCGANTRAVRGVTWFGNDAVNFAATASGAIVAFALAPR